LAPGDGPQGLPRTTLPNAPASSCYGLEQRSKAHLEGALP
jgi:hypothetical protein